jgi:hypothetical protein
MGSHSSHQSVYKGPSTITPDFHLLVLASSCGPSSNLGHPSNISGSSMGVHPSMHDWKNILSLLTLSCCCVAITHDIVYIDECM